MRKLTSCAKISKVNQKKLAAIEDKPASWEVKKKLPEVKYFQDKVMKHGLKEQEHRCVWCTLLVGAVGRRRADRDHIASKGKYPHWTYTPLNIAIACEYCNGFSVKNALDTIEVDAANYEDCTFKVVHPYLVDDMSKHIVFDYKTNKKKEPGVAIRGVSLEGLWTIKKLKLDMPEMTVQRAMDYLYMEQIKKIAPHFRDLYQRATGRAAP